MRLLGLDYGSKTIGVAISDPTGKLATPIEIIKRDKENHLRKSLRRIETIIDKYAITSIVLGYPLSLDDTTNDRCAKTLEFKEILEQKFNLDITLYNEQLTTFEAYNIMTEQNIKSKDFEKYIDSYAAAVILQDYLNNIYNKNERE